MFFKRRLLKYLNKELSLLDKEMESLMLKEFQLPEDKRDVNKYNLALSNIKAKQVALMSLKFKTQFKLI